MEFFLLSKKKGIGDQFEKISLFFKKKLNGQFKSIPCKSTYILLKGFFAKKRGFGAQTSKNVDE